MHPVLAYIDPGSGSLLIQGLIAVLVAAPFVLRQQIGALVRRLKGEAPAVPAPVDSSPVDVDPAG